MVLSLQSFDVDRAPRPDLRSQWMQLSKLLVSREESRNLTGNLCTNYDMETFARYVFAAAPTLELSCSLEGFSPALIVRECDLGRDGLFGTSAYLSKGDVK